MPVLPVVNVITLEDLRGTMNGNLPADLLVGVGPSGYLHHKAARAWRALVASAARDGFDLTYTYGGTYRPYADQVALFRQRYSTIPQRGRPTKIWKSTTYWQLPNVAMAAVPGTSNHGLGLAVDTALGSGPSAAVSIGPRLGWLLAHAPALGFSWEAQSEAWHIRYVAGDNPPPAVLAYEAGLFAGPATADEPATAVEPEILYESEHEMSIRILRSMNDPPEFYAQFIAVCDAEGHSIELQWSGSGDDPKVVQRMADLRAAGIQESHITFAGVRNNVLNSRHRAADILDALHVWTDDDFA